MNPLWQQYQAAKEAAKGPYFPREGAEALGVSEGCLMAASPDAVYLGTRIGELVLKLHTLGAVEGIVRNSLAVHEKQGVYENVKWSDKGGIAVNVGGLDLRIFTKHWHHAIAVTGMSHGKMSRSIQFYDEFGVAVQKVFMRDESKLDTWEALLAEFRREGAPEFKTAEKPPVAVPNDLPADKTEAFRQAWSALKDVHDFGDMIASFGLDRQAAYRHAPQGAAKRLDNGVWEKVLEKVRDSGMEMMIFIGNRGVVQIQTGAVHKVVRARGYLNILDSETEKFSMHLKDDGIEETWVVRRPVEGGFVTCLEGFDSRRKTVVQFFGRRKEGQSELAVWQQITDDLLNG
ncbi:hemin-degrading factor [Neisseria weaveri]|uniref:Hemin transport protein hemS n=1 Tax=Neisseria weaveri TaxID=28091 RepID=A0A3S4ZAP2_9NEIS|nr:hemin-degrading factor [Neisseria weaveri]EGV37267.1 hypothetical protein l11_13700 [Neisseria weaveri LMG 5135]EGV37651.1 hypothetical protein l13_02860 [Neisseria weaveri ATCC 51223]VEJ49493.1 Hemin transport protein hemS [Neisseria weaveri]